MQHSAEIIPVDFCFKTKNMLLNLESDDNYNDLSYGTKLITKKGCNKRGRRKIETNRYVLHSEIKIA